MRIRQRPLHIRQTNSRLITRRNPLLLKPPKRRHPQIVLNRSLKELHNFLMLHILRPIARYIECTVARRMLTKLMRPELVVASALVDPVCIHPR